MPAASSISVRLAGRNIALKLAKAGKEWKAAAAVRMPEARGDIREIIGQPVFVPLQKLAIIYGKAGFSLPSALAVTLPGWAVHTLYPASSPA